MSTTRKKESRIKKCIKAPMRILIKARDCYVRNLTNCSGRIGYGGASGMGSCGAFTQVSSLPRSFSGNSSVSSGDEDFRELMRISSVRTRVELEMLRRKSLAKNGTNVVPRTRSVAIGRIDEEGPCDFDEEGEVCTDVYPRSRSCAVSSR
ncbi:hypothetical protein T459_06626 [Capsicum annuum]|uniref:Uncharacterized protein n=1 Tax=Capsicum annuum TaxID=4072 RepID=A0A2G3ABG6_CAPAN|nr:hypothetical protein FXO37_23673 [Capsicum annuum]PHT91513.1 hypothetical protein T459_06626 [Capsicum annuum]